MSDWLNPQHWMRQFPDPLGVRGLIHDGTAAWINELASAAIDRPIEVRKGHHSFTGTIRSLRLDPSTTPGPMGPADSGVDALDSAALEIEGVRSGERDIGDIKLLARDVRFDQRPHNRMTAGPVEVRAKVSIDALAHWLAEAGIEFVAADASRGEITVRYRWRRLKFSATVVPDTTSTEALFTVRTLRLRGRMVPLPKRFNLALTLALPVRDTVRLRGATFLDDQTLSIEAELSDVEYPVSALDIIDWLATGRARSVIDLNRGN